MSPDKVSLNQARAEHLVKGALSGDGRPGKREYWTPRSTKQISSTPRTWMRHASPRSQTQVYKNSRVK